MTRPAIHIVVIEDNPTDILLLEDVLSRDPFNSFILTTTERLNAGLETLHKNTFDLVLLDLDLPDSKGLDTLQRLHAEFPEIPVVVLTGLTNERIALEAVQSGAQDYLVKGPTTWEIASRAIRYAIERQQMQAHLRESEARYRVLFENSPVSIWEQDFSQVKKQLDSLKREGVTDFKQYFSDHPQAAHDCVAMIRVLDVNKAGLKMYRAEKKEDLIEATQEEIGAGEMEHLQETLIAIADGEISQSWEGEDETMIGERLEISLNWSVAPGYEEDYSKVIVTTIDITERKRVEEALRDSEARHRLATRATKDVIWEWNAKTRQLRWTGNAQIVFGYSPDEIGPDET